MLPLRLRRVAGWDGRANDVLYHPPARPAARPADAAALVFFGGDVQDYPEIMRLHRDNRNYLRWSLDGTARALHRLHPEWHVLVVRPTRIEYKSFSCYDNFVPGNSAGVPDHTPTHRALQHLERLLQSVSVRLKVLTTEELLGLMSPRLDGDADTEDVFEPEADGAPTDPFDPAPPAAAAPPPPENPLWWREGLCLERLPLSLVGFSKGCVVLNQLIYEFHYAKTLTPGDAHVMRFISSIRAMTWLDGGHAGGKNTWITARSLLETLTRLDINIFIHVSPYQVRDESRPWIGREERAFTALLTELGAKARRYMHGEGRTPHTLHMHFDVLTHFGRAQQCVPAAQLCAAAAASNEGACEP